MIPSLKVIVRGTKVIAELTDVLTSGMVGVPVTFQFDESWNCYRKIAVFENVEDNITKDRDLNIGGEIEIPWEVLQRPGTLVRVGVEGRNADGTVVIPAQWAEVGVVLSGAQAGNDPALEPTPTVYDQIMQAIDDGRLQGDPGYTPVKGVDYFDGAPGYTPVKGVDYFDGDDGEDGISPVVDIESTENGHKVTITDADGEKSFEVKDGMDGAPPIVCESSGENILLTDSAKAKLRGLKLYGKSEQFTTTGANLFDVSMATSITSEGTGHRIDITTGTIVGVTNTQHASDYISVNPNATYTLNFSYYSSGDYGMAFYDSNKAFISGQKQSAISSTSVSTPFTFTTPDNCAFVRFTTLTDSEQDISAISLNAGTTALPWEPYTGGKPSPSPEYPQEIVSAGQDGEIGVMVGGKNLFSINSDPTTAHNGLTFTRLEDGGYKFTGTATTSFWAQRVALTTTIPADGTYTFSVYADIYTSKGVMYQHLRGDTQIKVYSEASKAVYTAEMLKGDTILVLIGATAEEVVNSTVYAQLELGGTATDFEKPIEPQTLTALTPNGLPGIKVSSGGNYTDSTGQQWLCDVKDYGRGVEVPWVVPVIFDGSDDENWQNGYISDGVNNRFQCQFHSASGFGVHGTTKSVIVGAPCDKFNYEMVTAIPSVNSCRTVYNTAAGVTYVLFNPSTEIVPFEDVDAWRAFLSESPITMLFPVLNPIETPLTEEEMAQYRELHTNYPTTTVLNDEVVGMEVSYVADTKNYIDKKFTELAAAIVANA